MMDAITSHLPLRDLNKDFEELLKMIGNDQKMIYNQKWREDKDEEVTMDEWRRAFSSHIAKIQLLQHLIVCLKRPNFQSRWFYPPREALDTSLTLLRQIADLSFVRELQKDFFTSASSPIESVAPETLSTSYSRWALKITQRLSYFEPIIGQTRKRFQEDLVEENVLNIDDIKSIRRLRAFLNNPSETPHFLDSAISSKGDKMPLPINHILMSPLFDELSTDPSKKKSADDWLVEDFFLDAISANKGISSKSFLQFVKMVGSDGSLKNLVLLLSMIGKLHPYFDPYQHQFLKTSRNPEALKASEQEIHQFLDSQKYLLKDSSSCSSSSPPLSPPQMSQLKEEFEMPEGFRDLRNLECVAIDAEKTFVVDDAFSVEKQSDGSIRIYVHVSHPTRWLKPSLHVYSLIEQRVRTGYFSDTMHLLPLPLLSSSLNFQSTNFCNFALTFSFRIPSTEEDSTVERKFTDKKIPTIIEKYQVEVFQSIIKGDIQRINFETAHHLLRGEMEMARKYLSRELSLNQLEKLAEIVKMAEKFSRARNRERVERGAVRRFSIKPNFSCTWPLDQPDRRFADPTISFYIESVSDASSLVEEMMISTGETAALLAAQNGIAIPFRVQDKFPEVGSEDQENLVFKVAAELHPSIKEVLGGLKPNLAAHFSPIPSPHISLGLEQYCWATSPLRRFSDILVHSQLADLFVSPSKNKGQIEPVFSLGQMRSYCNYLTNREAEIKQLGKYSQRFWAMQLLAQDPVGKIYQALVISDPTESSVDDLRDFYSVSLMVCELQYLFIRANFPIATAALMQPNSLIQFQISSVDPLSNLLSCCFVSVLPEQERDSRLTFISQNMYRRSASAE